MKYLKTILFFTLFMVVSNVYSQYLPASYEPMLNEIVICFETIRGSNSITQGKNVLSVLNKDKITLRIDHKNSIKNLTFITKPDEEGKNYWAPANPLTIDMVNKYEDDLTKIMESMLKYAQKKSKE